MLRKILIFISAATTIFSVTNTFADHVNSSGIYIEANGGYAIRNWNNLRDNNEFYSTVSNSRSNSQGGFLGGADLGYQFSPYWAAEVGYIYLPTVKGTSAGTAQLPPPAPSPVPSGVQMEETGYAVYAGFKLLIPVTERVGVFGKLAAAYQNNKLTNVVKSPGNINPGPSNGTQLSTIYWDPMFATGIQCYLTANHDWSVNAQYTYLMGYHGSDPDQFGIPSSNIFTAGIGYQFAV